MKDKLLVYNRGMMTLYQIYAPIKAGNELATELTGVKFKTIFFAHHKNKVWFSWHKDEMYNLGKKIWEITSTPKGLNTHLQRMKEFMDKANKTAREIHKTDSTKLSDQELIHLHQKMYDDCKEAHALTDTDVDAINIFPVELLKKLIKKQVPELDEKSFLKVYTQLTTPICTTYVTEEEKTMLELLVKMKQNDITVEQLKDSKLYPDFEKVINKFWWTNLGWENTELRTEKDWLDSLKDYQKNTNPEKRIKEIENQEHDLGKKRAELIKKYNLNEETEHRLKVFDQYAIYQDLRKIMHTQTIHAFQLILKEAAKRTEISWQNLEYYTFEEISDFLFGKKQFDEQEFKERELAQFVLANENGIEILKGQPALDKINEYYPRDLEEVTEIKGTCSSQGKAKGIAKVCLGIKDAIKKIEEGDILITGMTTPDYVIVMRKAAAIVTNEGGITCHAAIVSRELGVPCITSTKNATEVFKDGDLVEVDASNEIVRKLN